MRTRKHIKEVGLPERNPRETGIEAPSIFYPKKEPAKQPQEVPSVPIQTPTRVPTGNEIASVEIRKG